MGKTVLAVGSDVEGGEESFYGGFVAGVFAAVFAEFAGLRVEWP